MTLVEVLAWITVVGLPVLTLGAMAFFVIWWLRRKPAVSQPYAYTPPPPTWQETKTTITTTAPEITGIDEESWNDDEPETQDELQNRADLQIYHVYRSVDRKTWVECDQCLTERAACNYAKYIKANNPHEYVKCEDPTGLILSYE